MIYMINKKTEKEIKKQIAQEELRIERTQIFVAINVLYAQKILKLDEMLRCGKRLQEKYYEARKKLL